MKPPPRKRTKPERQRTPDPPKTPRQGPVQWQRTELKNLLKALQILYKKSAGNSDVDYDYLKKHVPTRSITELQTLVDFLKDNMLSLVSFKLNKRRLEEKSARKPIDMWTQMASTIAGSREEAITAAFSQMLMVSSTEPCTLKNCDPPHIQRVKDNPGGRTLPVRPMPRMPIQVKHPKTSTTLPAVQLKTPGPAKGPGIRPSAPSQAVCVLNSKPHPSTTAGTSAASAPTPMSASTPSPSGVAVKILVAPAPSPQPTSQTSTPVPGTLGSGSATPLKTQSVGPSLIQTPQLPSAQSPTPISASSPSEPPSSGTHAPIASIPTGQAPVPRTPPPSSAATQLLLSTPPAGCYAKFGCTSKYTRKDNPRVSGVMGVVDFEKIYGYLSCIHQPNNDCNLTPMESAIMLDLLMSLPEELPLLDCNKLHKHLNQVYQFLSSTADSKMAQQMFEELKEGLCAGGDERGDSQQSPAQASGGKNLQPNEAESESSGSADAPGQTSGRTDAPGQSGNLVLCPALNPFMVPLKLLMRK
ncbi:snapc2 [Pungitius sinensis]